MRRVMVVACVVLLAMHVSLAADIVFSDVAWGTKVEDAKSQLVAAGFEFKNAVDGIGLVFEGKLLGQNAIVLAIFTDKDELVKVMCSLSTADEECVNTYRMAKSVLTEKYGKPTKDFDYYRPPYRESDCAEIEAIRAGKRALAVMWGNGSPGLMVIVESSGTVMISYEGPGLNAECARQVAESAKKL